MTTPANAPASTKRSRFDDDCTCLLFATCGGTGVVACSVEDCGCVACEGDCVVAEEQCGGCEECEDGEGDWDDNEEIADAD